MIKLLKKDDNDFPELLRIYANDIDHIYYKGNLDLLKMTSVAVVGSRKCTPYGKTVAKEIGKKASIYNVCVISGLARGIDTAAHEGVLSAGGKTIAVLGGGLDTYYPKENRALQDRIAKEGLLLSLNPPGQAARRYDFPIRNRVISALSESVVIVEAAIRSGALITCECAAELGKNVYAVPGNITSHYSFGCNQLIRDTVTPLVLIDDLFTDLGKEAILAKEESILLSDRERTVFELIKKYGEITIDEIRKITLFDTSEISGIITILEMKGLIFSSLGKFFVAKF